MYTVELIDRLAELNVSEKRAKGWISRYSSRTGEAYDRHIDEQAAEIILRLPGILEENRAISINEALDIATGVYVPSVSTNGARQILLEIQTLHDKVDSLIERLSSFTDNSSQNDWQETVSTALEGLDRRLTDVAVRLDQQAANPLGAFLTGGAESQ